MRKLISILLLLLLCSSLAGYHLLFQFQIEKAKLEMMSFLKKQKNTKDVITFSFDKNELQKTDWENDKEFEYKNEMYDVIEKTNVDGRLVIRCVSDENETALLNEYQKTNKQNHSEFVLQLLTASFLLPNNYFTLQPLTKTERLYANQNFPLQSLASSVALPPPDVF